MQPIQIVERVSVSASIDALFMANLFRVMMKLDGLGNVRVDVVQYTKRLDMDNWSIHQNPNDCIRMPTEWHACLTATSRLLRHIGKPKLVYEGDPDPTVNIKNVLQAHAKLYGVDVNDLAASYPRVRPWLLHRQLDYPLPVSFDEFENRLKLAGDTNIK